ncbi:MAG: S8 family serine peptidase [Candidatus Krumholzibacteriota bacterium]
MYSSRIARFFMFLLPIVLMTAVPSHSQRPTDRALPTPETRVTALQELAGQLEASAMASRTAGYDRLLRQTSGPQAVLNRSDDLLLRGIRNGRPLYYQTTNLFAAQTVGTDHLWPGGITGMNLSGANLPGELALWDAGRVMDTHQEFGGRVYQQDAPTYIGYHATHVAGTLIAAGTVPIAKGMSPSAYLHSYDWSLDDSEMAAAAAGGLLVSNHSYSNLTGWLYRSGEAIPWYWYGDPAISETEDPGFGMYDVQSQGWDQIAHDAPNYLIVKSAGNDRNDFGPAAGTQHYVWDTGTAGWVTSTTTRAADGGVQGYDSIPYKGNAKNILTIGAVFDISGGWSQASDVVNSTFGGWGPTDDGRIKPDLVANGLGLYSCYIDSNSSYIGLSGTSMSSPNTAGTLNLLAQLWRDTHAGQTPRSATLKGIALHTASEAGSSPGPDYSFGWGLLNALGAAYLIAGDVSFDGRAVESVLSSGTADTLVYWSDGINPVAATICWTDPAAAPSVWSLDPPDPKLVNDLDLRIERVADTISFLPWTLDPANPTAAATPGFNFRDNVEKVEIASPIAGLHRLIIAHKGTLDGGSQAYSLLTSGLGDQPQTPTVTNVVFSQRTDGSGLVDVTFDLSDPNSPTVAVSMEVSSDGGSTWNLAANTVSGDIGSVVAVGAGRAIVWDFAQDHPGVFLPEVVVRITALD